MEDYEHNLYVRKKSSKTGSPVVSVDDVFKIGNTTFIQFRKVGNNNGKPHRRTTLSKDKFHENYRNVND